MTLTSAGSAADGPTAAAGAAEIIIVDCSGLMNTPRSKIAEARAATAAAVDVILEGVAFAVIAGTHQAAVIFPDGGGLAVADARTRKAAKKAVARLRPGGGTAIGQWLRLAQEMFSSHPAQLRHAILLADGRDENESSADLDKAISLCEGVFSCDCRAVGNDWQVDELRRISTALLGTLDIVPGPRELGADFEAMMLASMARQVADVALRVWTPRSAGVQFVRQVAPEVVDLTDRRAEPGPQIGDYPTGAWGAGESRDYHLRVQVAPPGPVGQEMLAARVSLIARTASGPQTLGHGLVRAIWTDDEALSTQISPHVAHYTGQAELAQAIQDGLQALRMGDAGTAVAELGRAVQLAHQSGNQQTAKLLAKVVDVIDPATGTVRLKPKVADTYEGGQRRMFERFTGQARRVVVLAQEEARMLGHNYIGTEHILLGLIREGEGAAGQVLVRLGADMDRVRQQVIQLLHGYQGKEPVSAGTGPVGLAADVLNRIDAIESRLSALELHLGTGPDVRSLDTEIAQARLGKESAIAAEDFEAAASLRDKEKQLLAEKTSRYQQWTAAHPDPPSLTDKVGQLSDQIEQLRGLLRQQGPSPEEGTA